MSEIDVIVQIVYPELRRVARGMMLRERPGHTLQATALVHEAVLRVLRMEGLDLRSQEEFFALAVQQMRRTLVNHARQRMAHKRFGVHISMDGFDAASEAINMEETLMLDQVLDQLAAIDERAARIVGLRFFAGLSVEETAAVLGINGRMVLRDWEFARTWLFAELSGKRITH